MSKIVIHNSKCCCQGIYTDMERLFRSDLFHMGGDEVNINCWNSTQAIAEWMNNK